MPAHEMAQGEAAGRELDGPDARGLERCPRCGIWLRPGSLVESEIPVAGGRELLCFDCDARKWWGMLSLEEKAAVVERDIAAADGREAYMRVVAAGTLVAGQQGELF